MKYHKINSPFKRDHQTGKFISEWSVPEFEMLSDIQWRFDEKVDGINVSVMFEVFNEHGGQKNTLLKFGCRTDNSQIPVQLMEHLQKTFYEDKMFNAFDNVFNINITLFGEGYGAKIQKGGGDYRDDQGFILFDININGMWLTRESIEEIGDKLSVPVAPIIGYGTLKNAIDLCDKGFDSKLRKSEPEGLIIRPVHELLMRNGNRVITKLKLSDFR